MAERAACDVREERKGVWSASVARAWRSNTRVSASFAPGRAQLSQVGYRWYNSQTAVTPHFPFGHGLSYGGPYAYSNLVVSRGAVSAEVENTGLVAGYEVAQLYLTYPEAAGEPPKQLKGFAKLALAPGEKQQVSFQLSGRSRSAWNATSHGWEEAPGTFTAAVGASVGDLRLSGDFEN